MRLLLFAIMALCAPLSAAPLEEWSCVELANYYGIVAVDRDAGVSIRDRISVTVKAMSGIDDLSLEDAHELLSIVRYVYRSTDYPGAERKAALRRCLGGSRALPQARGVSI